MLSVQTRIASNAERKQWCYKKHEPPRNFIISFLIHIRSPISGLLYNENYDIEEKENAGQPTFPFPFHPSLFISKPGVGSVIKCAYIKK